MPKKSFDAGLRGYPRERVMYGSGAPLAHSNPLQGRWKKDWRPQGDLNPRRRRERAVSLAELDDGDAHESTGYLPFHTLPVRSHSRQISHQGPPESLINHYLRAQKATRLAPARAPLI